MQSVADFYSEIKHVPRMKVFMRDEENSDKTVEAKVAPNERPV